jgi:hypothetical protein
MHDVDVWNSSCCCAKAVPVDRNRLVSKRNNHAFTLYSVSLWYLRADARNHPLWTENEDLEGAWNDSFLRITSGLLWRQKLDIP